MDGKRCCPPEDVGGAEGYAEFLRAIGDPMNKEHAQLLDWCGGAFDPNAFDSEHINLELAKYARWSRPRAMHQKLVAEG